MDVDSSMPPSDHDQSAPSSPTTMDREQQVAEQPQQSQPQQQPGSQAPSPPSSPPAGSSVSVFVLPYKTRSGEEKSDLEKKNQIWRRKTKSGRPSGFD